MDPKFWVSGNTNGVQREAYFHADTLCSGPTKPAAYSFCGWYGTHYDRGAFATTDGNLFAIAGSGGQPGLLTQYFPTVTFPVRC